MEGTALSAPVENAPREHNDIWAKVRPAVLKTIVGSVVAAALVGVTAIVVGQFGTIHLQALFTVIFIVTFALLAWYDAEVSAKRSSTFALIGVGISVILLIIGMLKIWLPQSSDLDTDYAYYYDDTSYDVAENFGHWIWLVVIARFALLHAHLLLNIHRKYNTPVLSVVANITLGLIALFGILLALPSIFDNTDFGEAYWRLFGAVLILDVLGTVLIPLAYALFSPKKSNWEDYERFDQMPQIPQMPVQQQQHFQSPARQQLHEQYDVPSQPVAHRSTFQPTTSPVEPPAQAFGPTGAVKFEQRPTPSRKLAWPRYEDGTPLPINPDGTPNFDNVERF
jgi:hypothetical protein